MTATIALPLLDRVRVASPCAVKWDDMTRVGDGEQVRHCGQCGLNVHNLSALTRDEAESLLASRTPGRRFCATFYQRADGTVLTRDCPVGLRAARARLARLITRLAAGVAVVLGGVVLARTRDNGAGGLRELRPFSDLSAWVRGRSAPPVREPMIAGDICIPPPLPPPPGAPPRPAGGPS